MADAPGSGFEYFEVAADVGVHAWGRDMAEAFAQAALGVLALGITPQDVREQQTREVRAQGDGRETLLVSWINECLYVHEIEGFAVRRVEVDRLAGGLVHGVLHGEEIDAERHSLGTVVKAATLHEAAVVETPGRVEIKVSVDI
jgi:SHS2 domain-containing protein